MQRSVVRRGALDCAKRNTLVRAGHAFNHLVILGLSVEVPGAGLDEEGRDREQADALWYAGDECSSDHPW